MTGVLVVGEALIDIVQRPDGTTVEHSGGSAANVAVALARLGRPVQLLTAYGDDERGAVLARHLNQSAVGLIGDPHSLERTATAAATLGPDGGAAYTFDIDWRLNALPDPSPVVVHTCSIGAVLEPGASDVRRLVEALRPRATVSYDVNARPAVTGSGPDVVRAVEEMAALADLVKASTRTSSALLPRRARRPGGRAPAGARAGGRRRHPGRQGAVWFGSNLRVEVPVAETEVADTIGAGDTFGAGILDALWTSTHSAAARSASRRMRSKGSSATPPAPPPSPSPAPEPTRRTATSCSDPPTHRGVRHARHQFTVHTSLSPSDVMTLFTDFARTGPAAGRTSTRPTSPCMTRARDWAEVTEGNSLAGSVSATRGTPRPAPSPSTPWTRTCGARAAAGATRSGRRTAAPTCW
jgi:fructokinase